MLALFDLDNTLVDRALGFRLWAKEFCTEHRLGADAVEWLVRADGDGIIPKEAFFAQVRDQFSVAEPVDSLWAHYRQRHTALIPACPGVLGGLVALRAAGWRIGVVTNGLADVQLATLRRSRIADYVDGWAISGAEGVRKPEVRLFEIAAQRCGVPLAGWMVGDSATADIRGGRAAGLRTIWVDRGRPWPGGTVAADHTVTDTASAIGVLLSDQTRRVYGTPPTRSST